MWLPDGTQGSVTIAGTTYDEEGWNVAAGWYSRFSYNSVVDDRSRRPVFSPLCCCVDRCQVWDVMKWWLLWTDELWSGFPRSWKVLDFFGYNFQVLESPENGFSPGKSWKFECKVLESPGIF